MALPRAIYEKYKKMILFLTGVFCVCFFYLSWCFSTISYQSGRYALMHLITVAPAVLLYVFCVKKSRQIKKIGEQTDVLNVLLICTFVLMFIYDIRKAEYRAYFVMADILWLAAGIFCLRRKKININIKKNYPLLIILAVSALLASEPFTLQSRWDGVLYEMACRNMDIHSLSSLGAYGHLSQAFGSLYFLINILVNNTAVSMAVLNMILYLGGIAGFYLLVKHQFPQLKMQVQLTGTLIYAFSPYFMGMEGYYSLDYATACLFVWVVYFAVTKRWLFHFVISLCFCFTKEPAIVTYGAFCVGLVIMDLCRNHISKVVRRYEYYLMLLTGILWISMYLMIGGWSGGVGVFKIDASYVVDKLKVLYVLNFNWLMVIIIVAGIIVQIRKREPAWHFPILLSMLAFTVFSSMFNTVNHARYSAAVPASLYILAFSFLVTILKENTARNIMLVLSILMCLSSFKTIDIVSLSCFQKLNIGKDIMITTGSPVMGDSMIYNKQMLWQETAFNKALDYAMENDLRIYVPAHNGSLYAFDGMMTEGVWNENICEVVQYWSDKDNKRYNYNKADTVPFVLYEMDENGTISGTLPDKLEGCYIYSTLVGTGLAQDIIQKIPDAEYREFSYRGWTVLMLVF